jgi:hypothetical protein
MKALYRDNRADEAGAVTTACGGNGLIGETTGTGVESAEVFIDAIYLSSAPANTGGTNWSGSIWIDTVAYNPDGTLNNLVPEPGLVGILPPLVAGLIRRRR